MIFIHNEIQPVNLESAKDYMEFISIKVKTDHVLNIHNFLKESGFDHQDSLDHIFRYSEIKDKTISLLNSTCKADFQEAIDHNSILKKFI